MKTTLAALAMLVSVCAHADSTAMPTDNGLAGNITITSPNNGDYLGQANKVKFTITGASVQVTVKVTATLDSNPAIKVTVEDEFDPDVSGEIEGNIDLNFASSTPEGDWTLTFDVEEPGNTYNVIPSVSVIVDVRDPLFRNSNPLVDAFVRGVVNISAELDEPNIKEWRVRINNSDIPNNSGTTTTVAVIWDTGSIIDDGSQTISIVVEDLAGNKATKTIAVTLDRVNPSSTILAPTAGSIIRPGSRITVVVEILDQFNNSVHRTGIDVELRRLDDSYLGRVSRRSLTHDGNRATWVGRIRRGRNMPNEFKVVVSVVDKAGNIGIVQEVTVRISGRGRGRGRGDSPPRRRRWR